MSNGAFREHEVTNDAETQLQPKRRAERVYYEIRSHLLRNKFPVHFQRDRHHGGIGPRRAGGKFWARTERAQMGEEKKGRQEKTEGGATTKPTGAKRRRRRNKAAFVREVISKIEEKLSGDDAKPSVGDFIRLLQLEKELEEEQPREIQVSWVEPERTGGNDAPGK